MEIKRKKDKKLSKSWFIITGSLLVISGILSIIFDIFSDKHLDNLEDQALKEFYIQETEIVEEIPKEDVPITKSEEQPKKKVEYIAAIKIPKINIERGLVAPNSYLNNIQYNIAFLKGSDMPDQLNGNVMLAAHSGNARVSYFKNLDKLSVDDKVIIEYKGKSYTYAVVNIYDIPKKGKAKIIRNKNVNTLTLITCRHNTNNQIVVICELINSI